MIHKMCGELTTEINVSSNGRMVGRTDGQMVGWMEKLSHRGTLFLITCNNVTYLNIISHGKILHALSPGTYYKLNCRVVQMYCTFDLK